VGARTDDVSVRLDKDQLVVDFTLPLKESLAVTYGAGVDVFDAEFYFTLRFADPGIDARSAPAACRVDRRRAFDEHPIGPPGSSLNDAGAGFAVRVRIVCPS
jgi:hypothetical protein